MPHLRAVVAQEGDVAFPRREGPEGPNFLQSTPDPFVEHLGVPTAMPKRRSLIDFFSPRGFKSKNRVKIVKLFLMCFLALKNPSTTATVVDV